MRNSTPEVDGRAPIVLEIFALEFANRLLEELGVHLEADRLDVPALLAAEQVAGAADLEVERRDAEAAAERAELLDRRKPLARHLRQRVHGRDQQVRVRTPIRPADATAQLVQLTEAVAIGAVDDHRVGVGDIEAVLDDRRRQQHVVAALDEVHHDLLERFLAHLPVTDADTRAIGRHALQQTGHRLDGLDAVVHEVDLPAAFEFLGDRRADDLRIERQHRGLHGLAIVGRGLDHRHVADADERHVERARDGRRAHREHVDPLAHLLDALLVRDAESLLLVDDEQARDP